jgi:hypothetical protein
MITFSQYLFCFLVDSLHQAVVVRSSIIKGKFRFFNIHFLF